MKQNLDQELLQTQLSYVCKMLCSGWQDGVTTGARKNLTLWAGSTCGHALSGLPASVPHQDLLQCCNTF